MIDFKVKEKKSLKLVNNRGLEKIEKRDLKPLSKFISREMVTNIK